MTSQNLTSNTDFIRNTVSDRQSSSSLVDAVNKALSDMKADGTYLKISEKWFGADVSK
jgi:cystine transport system substrate-binding protein